MAVVTMLFNEGKSIGTSNVYGILNIGRDVETIALHEFGHFGGSLLHSYDNDDIMCESYQGCRREWSDHDIETMDARYDNHP